MAALYIYIYIYSYTNTYTHIYILYTHIHTHIHTVHTHTHTYTHCTPTYTHISILLYAYRNAAKQAPKAQVHDGRIGAAGRISALDPHPRNFSFFLRDASATTAAQRRGKKSAVQSAVQSAVCGWGIVSCWQCWGGGGGVRGQGNGLHTLRKQS